MRQIALPLDELRPATQASLIITESNAPIIAALDDGGNWPGRCAILCGPARSGKSLMARYFKTRVSGQVIEDAHRAGDEILFNAWNRAQGERQALLLVSPTAPAGWNVTLPDLRSRLGGSLLLQIPPPDDELIGQLLLKFLQDRGTTIGVDALAYVKKRIDRRYAAIETFARDANKLALSENSAINLSLVKRLLNNKI